MTCLKKIWSYGFSFMDAYSLYVLWREPSSNCDYCHYFIFIAFPIQRESTESQQSASFALVNWEVQGNISLGVRNYWRIQLQVLNIQCSIWIATPGMQSPLSYVPWKHVTYYTDNTIKGQGRQCKILSNQVLVSLVYNISIAHFGMWVDSQQFFLVCHFRQTLSFDKKADTLVVFLFPSSPLSFPMSQWPQVCTNQNFF